MLKEPLTQLTNEPLLQHGELRAARPIAHPEKLSVASLHSWLSFAQSVCDTQGFQCLAFTELPKTTQEVLGFFATLPPRVIYYRTDVSQKGQLIINPIIDTDFPDNPSIPMFEACGSIEHGKLWHFIERPASKTIKGWFYNGKSYREQIIEPTDPYVDLSIHETDHLDGKTALNFPHIICDLQSRKAWALIRKWYGNYSPKEMRAMITDACPNGILSFNRANQKFVLVTAEGKFLREYIQNTFK